MRAIQHLLLMTLIMQISACGIDVNAESKTAATGSEIAIFAGGCFWCMEPPYDKVDGVISTISGYTGGHTKNPTYKSVSSGRSGHAEVLQVSYDPSRVSYQQLLEIFWRNIDPTRDDGQFCDRGTQYRPAIYYLNEEQLAAAQASRDYIEQTKTFPDKLKVEITRAGKFYPAEEYHQDYYKKNPVRYKYYRYSCGRDKRLKQLWGDMAG